MESNKKESVTTQIHQIYIRATPEGASGIAGAADRGPGSGRCFWRPKRSASAPTSSATNYPRTRCRRWWTAGHSHAATRHRQYQDQSQKLVTLKTGIWGLHFN